MAILKEPVSLKVMLTGASGFVGGRLRDALLDAGADVVAIVRKSSPKPTRGRSVMAEYERPDELAELLLREKPELLIHVAGATKGVSYEDFARANVTPTRSLIVAAERAHPELRRFVLVSSLAAYGPSTAARPCTETDEPAPIEYYGKSKLEAERVLATEAKRVPFTILRPSGVYGPGDADYFNLFREVARGRNVYFGNRRRWFSALYVDDCVRAIVAAALSEKTKNQGYFLCDGRPITWQTFQEEIVRTSGKSVRTLDLPEALVGMAAVGGELLSRIDHKPRLFNRQKALMSKAEAWTCRHDKAQHDFGYQPAVPLEDGVRLAWLWYQQQGWM
ncbi:MAG: NAD-dependent epimerase/dehydratase family protein [Myxococcales bacterium]|nr:NAD-dependent epimerase/dehydratase family protein [Myxococcales bacterium]